MILAAIRGQGLRCLSDLRTDMPEDEENEAIATYRIIEAESGETVGLLYEWEDGVKQPLWFDGEKFDVVTVEIRDAECFERD